MAELGEEGFLFLQNIREFSNVPNPHSDEAKSCQCVLLKLLKKASI